MPTNKMPSPARQLPALCHHCASMLSSPENLRRIHSRGIPLCVGPDDAAAAGSGIGMCPMRVMAKAKMRERNKDVAESNAKDAVIVGWTQRHHVIDDDPSKGTYLLAKLGGRGVATDDINVLDLVYRFHGETADNFLLRFEVSTMPGDPASRYISRLAPILDLGSSEAFEQTTQWVNTCNDTHRGCAHSRRDKELPTRVLDVGHQSQGTLSFDTVRIYTTLPGKLSSYVALSYCWGGPQDVALRMDNVMQMHDGIAVETLPQTLKDAIMTTRKLQMRYLWIDALCIIQDSPADMVQELKNMPRIYQNASITICAASSPSVGAGFLKPRALGDSVYPQFTVPFRAWDHASDGLTPETVGQVFLRIQQVRDAHEEPINQRAWTLQEKLLSPRLLIYGSNEHSWVCREGTFTRNMKQIEDDNGFKHLSVDWSSTVTTLPAKKFNLDWQELVIDYSHRNLSFAADKLVALAGLASEYQRRSDGDVYLAGLWQRTIPQWLMWMRYPYSGQPDLLPRPVAEETSYIAPSWSWAPVTGAIEFHPDHKPYATIVSCTTTPINEELPTAGVKSGILEIKGPARQARWSGEALLRGSGDRDEDRAVIGKIFVDADEPIPDNITCLRMADYAGLVLAPVHGGGPNFRRVGLFEVHGKFKKSCDAWYHGASEQLFTVE